MKDSIDRASSQATLCLCPYYRLAHFDRLGPLVSDCRAARCLDDSAVLVHDARDGGGNESAISETLAR